MGIRISWSRGEVRIYIGSNKHYSAVFQGIQNAWSNGLDYQMKEYSPWAEATRKKADEELVRSTIRSTAYKISLASGVPEEEEEF